MTPLPHGARCSEFIVSPSNWESVKASTDKPWYIKYRYYDAAGLVKQVVIKGMNRTRDRRDRQQLTRELLTFEREQLTVYGYNPILKKNLPPEILDYAIDPTTPFIPALRRALARLDAEADTRRDIGYIIDGVEVATRQLQYTGLPIADVRKRHLNMLLSHCYRINDRYSDNTYNHYLKYLRILFTELSDIEAIEFNPAAGIKKKTLEVKERLTLTDEQRAKVEDHLKQYPDFHRFVHIFFHSGGRIKELMRLRGEHVDLQGQRYKALVKKGKKPRWVWRTIKDIALPLWAEQMQGCGVADFVFSVGLRPGLKQIRHDQVTKRWYRLVKNGKDADGKPLGIEADLYSLKHLNTSEVVDQLSEEDAARLNGHSTTSMVIKIYDTKREDRQHQRLKGVGNKFA